MNFFGDDSHYNDSHENEVDTFCTDQEIYEEFLKHCIDYKIEFDRIIIENGENRFTVFPPNREKTEKFIIYEADCGGRYSSTAESIEELLEEALSVVGEEKIKLKQKGKSI